MLRAELVNGIIQFNSKENKMIRIKELAQSFFLVFIIWVLFDHFYIQPNLNEKRELFNSWDNFIKSLGVDFILVYIY